MSAMAPYVVRQGDHLTGLALRMGFDPEVVWNHPKNANLRAARPSGHILCAGDVLYVPVPEKKWLPASTGQVNQYVAKVPKVPVSVTFTRGGQPLANEPCVVRELPDLGKLTTDGAGALKFDVPAHFDSVVVEMTSLGLQRRLRIGHLDPADTPSGALQRLRNMKYVSAGDTGKLAATRAIQRYQHVRGLPITGEIDDATAKQLVSDYGC
jgi:hypothetical protein